MGTSNLKNQTPLKSHSNTIENDQLKKILQHSPFKTYIWQHSNGDFKLIGNNKAFKNSNQAQSNDLPKEVYASDLYKNKKEIYKDILRCYKNQKSFERLLTIPDNPTETKLYQFIKYEFISPDLVVEYLFEFNEKLKNKFNLFAEQERYQRLVENLQDGVIILRINKPKVLFANHGVARLTGFSVNELLNLHIEELEKRIYFEDRERVKKIINEKISSNKKVREFCKFRICKKNQSIIWISVNYRSLNYKSSACVLFTLKDINELEIAQERLKKINSCLVDLGQNPYENINKITSLLGDLMNGDCAIYNRLEDGLLCSRGIWKEPKNYTPFDNPEGHICYDVIKKGGQDLFIVDDLQKTKYAKTDPNVVKYNLKSYIGKAVHCDGQSVGAICVVYGNAYRPIESDIELIGIIVSALSAQESRIKYLQEIEESEKTNRALLDASNHIEILLTNKFKILALNKTASSNFGKPPEKLIGSSILDYLPKENAVFKRDKLYEALKQGGLIAFEENIADKIFETRLLPVQNDVGIIYRIALFSSDVTEKKRNEYINKCQWDLALKLSSVTSLKKGLKICLDSVINISKMDCGYIFLFDEGNNKLHLKVHKGLSEEFIKKISNVSNCKYHAELIKTGKSNYFNFSEAKNISSELKIAKNLKSIGIIPIKQEKSVIGSIVIASYLLSDVPKYLKIVLETIATEIGDTIARLDAENKLRENDKMITILLNESPDIQLLIKSDMSIKMINRTAANSLDVRQEELIGVKLNNLLFDDLTIKNRIKILKEVIAKKKAIFFEDQRGGKIFKNSFYPILNQRGQVDLIAIYAKDITKERKDHDTILRILQAVKSSSDGILIMDNKFNIVYKNPAFLNIFEYKPNELNDIKSIQRLYENPSRIKSIYDILKKEKSWIGLIKMHTKKGKLIYIVLRVDIVQGDDGKTVGYIAIHRDLTEHITMQRQRDQFEKRMGETEKLITLGQLASSVAHEINNPLDIISTKLYLLEKEFCSKNNREKSSTNIEKIKYQVDRLHSLAKDILAYATPNMLVFKPVDINSLIESATDSIKENLDKKTHLKKYLDKSIVHAGTIYGDQVGLEIVIKNIIINSIEARKDDLTISIFTKLKSTDVCEIVIEDTGLGIEKNLINRIFEPFYTTKLDRGGTGLGLVICKKIIEEHDGKIFISSEKNKATRVTMNIPIKREN